MSNKKVIAVDIDEVLMYFVRPLAEFHNKNYGTNLKEDDFFSYEFYDVWGGNYDDCQEKVYKFFESQEFAKIQLVPGCVEGIKQLKECYDLVVVTSRQHILKNKTIKFINETFPDCFKDIVFGNHYGMEGSKMSKKDMCKQVNAFCLIDDSLKYAKDCSSTLEKILLFGDYAWNKKNDDLPSNVIRCKNWEEIVKNLIPQ